jgi:hypothetical protein
MAIALVYCDTPAAANRFPKSRWLGNIFNGVAGNGANECRIVKNDAQEGIPGPKSTGVVELACPDGFKDRPVAAMREIENVFAENPADDVGSYTDKVVLGI